MASGDVDHQVVGDAFERGAELGDGERLRRVQERAGAEQLAAAHRGFFDLGLELVDVHAALRERARDVAHDARAIVADHLEPHRDRAARRVGGLRGLDHDSKTVTLEGLERGAQIADARRRQADAQDARELIGEPRHPALLPVAADARDLVRERFDQTRAIRPDQGEHDLRLHDGSLRCAVCSALT